MKNAHEVALLFDAKAQSWDSKYRANGPLAYRAAAFSALLDGRVRRGAAVLDFGGGTGSIATALAQQGYQMTVCDVSDRMLAAGKRLYAGQAIEWLLLPAEWQRIPFANGTFDAIIASSVLEYLQDVENVLAECGRILRAGGALIFSVPNPSHPRRRLERLLRPLAILGLAMPPVRHLPKIGDYLRYLRVSRARFRAADWERRAAGAGLQAVKPDPGMPELETSKEMMYLVFKRPI